MQQHVSSIKPLSFACWLFASLPAPLDSSPQSLATLLCACNIRTHNTHAHTHAHMHMKKCCVNMLMLHLAVTLCRGANCCHAHQWAEELLCLPQATAPAAGQCPLLSLASVVPWAFAIVAHCRWVALIFSADVRLMRVRSRTAPVLPFSWIACQAFDLGGLLKLKRQDAIRLQWRHLHFVQLFMEQINEFI